MWINESLEKIIGNKFSNPYMAEKERFIQLSMTVPEHWHDIAIAILAEYGFEGFESRDSILIGYMVEDQYDSATIDELLAGLEYVEQVHIEYMAPQNWNHVWESNYAPVTIDDFCYVRAPFHPVLSNSSYQYVLDIQPQMSFGTGHHATTRAMISLMKEISFRGKDTLDMGCGTGILGILASKMGSREVIGVDIDPWSYENAIENASKNHVSNMKIILGDVGAIPSGIFDIILANINLNILVSDIPHYARHLKDEGVLLLSGFYESDLEKLVPVLESEKLVLDRQICHQKWMAVSTLQHNQQDWCKVQ